MWIVEVNFAGRRFTHRSAWSPSTDLPLQPAQLQLAAVAAA